MKKPVKNRFSVRFLRGMAVLLAVVCMMFTFSGTAMPVQAATQAELQQQLAAYEKKLEEDKKALAEMKGNTAAAQEKKKNLENQIATLKSQIAVLADSISQVQNSIGEAEQEIIAKETEISDKEAEIEQKQKDIDIQWADFKDRMAAMQEMHDCGTMAMLSTVTNLYQLLTFSDVLQDISSKDTEIMDKMKAQKEELEQAKQELEDAKAELEEQKAALEAQQATLKSQQATMQSKQSELSSDLVEAGTDLDEAKDAEAEAQALLDSDQMNYEAVYSQIQALVTSAPGSYSDLAFNGSFICPLSSYKRISSYYGYRTLGGVTKLHPGVDFAAPANTPIRAVASGYVTAAGWNSGGYGNYVLIYHGAMSDGETYSSLYGHMIQTPSVSAGQYVNQGDVIGYVGSTGNSTGNHLHLEIWQGSTAANSVANKATRVNPLSYVPA